MILLLRKSWMHQTRSALAFLLAGLLFTPFLTASIPVHAEGADIPSVQLRLLKTLQAPFVINRLAWHPDGRQLATAQNLNKTILVWDIATDKVIRTIENEVGGVDALAYSPDGKYLAVGRNFVQVGKANVHLYNTHTNALVRSFIPPSAAGKLGGNEANALAFSPDSRYLATRGYGGGTAVVYNVGTGEVASKLGAPGLVYSLAFSPNGMYLSVGRTDRTSEKKNEKGAYELASRVQLWNTASWSLVQQSTTAGSVSGLAFSPDNRHLAVGQTVEEYPGATAGRKLLPHKDKTAISVLAIPTLYREKIIPVHGRSPKSGFLLAASPQAYSSDGRFLFTSGSPAKVVDVKRGAILREINFTESVHFPAVSKDGKYLAVASGQEVRLYELVR